jgi:hypothetical protein
MSLMGARSVGRKWMKAPSALSYTTPKSLRLSASTSPKGSRGMTFWVSPRLACTMSATLRMPMPAASLERT